MRNVSLKVLEQSLNFLFKKTSNPVYSRFQMVALQGQKEIVAVGRLFRFRRSVLKSSIM